MAFSDGTAFEEQEVCSVWEGGSGMGWDSKRLRAPCSPCLGHFASDLLGWRHRTS